MESLRIEGTSVSPKVMLDMPKSTIEISGYSRPEDARDFYMPIIRWIEQFSKTVLSAKSKPQLVSCSFKFIYFNSSSAKYLFDIVILLKDIAKKGVPINVLWYYDEDDDELLEAGEELSEMSGIPFSFQQVRRD